MTHPSDDELEALGHIAAAAALMVYNETLKRGHAHETAFSVTAAASRAIFKAKGMCGCADCLMALTDAADLISEQVTLHLDTGRMN